MSITIETFDMDPEIDPYHASTGALTKTICQLTPEHKTIEVYQNREGDGTTMWEYHGRVIDIDLDRNETGEMPDPAELRELLESDEGQAIMQRIVDGYNTVWDGSNIRGHLSDGAAAAVTDLEQEIADLNRNTVETWTCDDWFQGTEQEYIDNPDATGEEIKAAAERAIDDARIGGQRFADDMTEHITSHVKRLRYDAMSSLWIDGPFTGTLTEYEAMLAETYGAATVANARLFNDGKLPSDQSPTGYWQAEYDPASGSMIPILDEDQSGDYVPA